MKTLFRFLTILLILYLVPMALGTLIFVLYPDMFISPNLIDIYSVGLMIIGAVAVLLAVWDMASKQSEGN